MRAQMRRSGLVAATLAVGLAFAAGDPTPLPKAAASPGSNGLIAFAGEDDGDLEIFTMPAVPDAVGTQLTHNDVRDTSPSWSWDGSRIVFQSSRDGGPERIYVMNADGSGQVRLTATADGDTDPAFSPDGTRIAFTRWHGLPSVQEIWVMDADGANQHEISTVAAPPGDPHPARGPSMEPTWSPDGSRIAFATRRYGDLYDIWAMAPDGTDQRPVLVDPASDDREPDWSPDGSRLVVHTSRSDSQLALVNVDGTSTSLGALSSAFVPAWSPDGTKVVFTTWLGGNPQLAVMPAVGGAPVLLTTSAADHLSPAWQPIPASAAVSRPDLRVHRSGGSAWTGDNRYPPALQQVRARVPRRRSATFEVRVQNDGTLVEGFLVRGTSGTASYAVQYYVGSTRVTGQVVRGTYRLPPLRVGALGPRLRVVVTVGPHARARSARTFTVSARGRSELGQLDAVRVTVARR